jgi:hypothetical protein
VGKIIYQTQEEKENKKTEIPPCHLKEKTTNESARYIGRLKARNILSN